MPPILHLVLLSIEFCLKGRYEYEYEAQAPISDLNMVPSGTRRMDIRTIVTARRWAEGHQMLFVMGKNHHRIGIKTNESDGKKD
jgi:hypothetical protein